MADKPILFSSPMVRALLSGSKTQTRRIIKPQPPAECSIHYMLGRESWLPAEQQTPLRHEWEAWTGPLFHSKPEKAMCGSFTVPMRFAPGDRLWVKHTADCFPLYFKPIPFGDGKYAVGTDGNVYRRDGDDWTKCAPRLSHNGYEEIGLRFNGEQRPFRINRLVAEAFYGPPPEGRVCRHMDGSRRNNQPGNLDWGTPAQNSADAVAAGSFSGERASKAQLSAESVADIRNSNRPQAELAEQYGVTQPTISKIKNGKRWSATPEAPPRNLPAWTLWRSPIFCPRWASRLTLTVTDVRVQRLQDISEEDAKAEGIEQHGRFFGLPDTDWDDAELSAVAAYHRLWNSINGPGSWEENPWIVAVSFTVERGNIDAL